MNLEKLLYKKISLWVFLLFIIIGLIVLSLFGSVVRHVAKGGILTGKVGFIADQIARYPGRVITLLNSYDIDPEPQIFDTEDTFNLKVHNNELFNEKEDGYLLVSTFDKNGSSVILFSLKMQKIIYSWKPPIDEIRKKNPNFIEGLNVKKFYRSQHPILFENGDLAFSSGGGPLVKIDKCGKLKWTTNEFFHHSNILYNNKIYSTITLNFNKPSIHFEDAVSIVDPSNGIILENIIIDDILKEYLNNNFSLLYGIGEYEKDLFHLNSVYPIKVNDQFFKKNDLVISLRNLSTILVYRPSEQKIKWLKTGPWINNHDAQYLGDGIFSVFSNNNVRGFEPTDFKHYEHSDVYYYDKKIDSYSKPYTNILKKIKMRSSGLVHVLDVNDKDAVIQLNNYGKIIRANKDGLVWTYQNYLGDNQKGNINWSKYIKRKDIALEFLKKPNCQN